MRNSTGNGAQHRQADRFVPALRRFQTRYRLGVLASGLMRGAVWAGGVFLAFGVLDYSAGFSDSLRHVVARILAVVAISGVILAVWRSLAVHRRDAAAEADHAAKSGRREVLSALDLWASGDGKDSPLAQWLRGRTIERAASRLGSLGFHESLPRERLVRDARIFLILAVILAALVAIAPRASWIVSRRLLQPGADIPPCSSLRFTLTPRPAEVLYGDDIVVTAEITGGTPDGPITVVTRDRATGRTEESPAFHEGGGRFSRKLEKMAVPVEITFVAGRARSEWLPVNVLMQPKIQHVTLTVQPPSYSGLPPREFAVGSQELAALAGSSITARVTSNRPLKGGRLEIAPPGGGAATNGVSAAVDGAYTARFEWTARTTSHLGFTVEEVLGTPSEALQVAQRITPDEWPEVVLREPSGDVLATPESVIPLEATASDDLGLKRVATVRRLQGYRERLRTEPVEARAREFAIREKLDLTPYHLVSGQVVELTLEAGDTNPNLLGVSVSETSRIHIISSGQYAAILRSQTTLEDFAGRYSAIQEAMEKAREALERLDQRLALDPRGAQAARRNALEAHKDAAKLFADLASDFPAFGVDAKLNAAATDVEKRLRENIKQLTKLERATQAELSSAMPALMEGLGAGRDRLAPELQDGERLIAAAKVFEQLGRFNAILEFQRELVRDLNRVTEQVRRGEMDGVRALQDLARRQAEVSQELAEMESQLDGALGALPEEFAALRKGGREFLALLRGSNPGSAMDAASAAASGNDSRTAGRNAGEALRRLEALLADGNCISSMCRGAGLPFPWPQDISATLDQLTKALIPRPGGGDQNIGGSGGGFSGVSESGYFVRGKMVRLPIYGPQRMQFSTRTAPGIGRGGNRGNGTGDADVAYEESGKGVSADAGGEAIALEAIPEAYREAVKRYFSIEADQPPDRGSNSSQKP